MNQFKIRLLLGLLRQLQEVYFNVEDPFTYNKIETLINKIKYDYFI